MDYDFIATMNLVSVGIIALMLLLMTFEAAYLKRLAILAVLLTATPLLIALLGNTLGWFDVYTIEVVTLRKGALSVVIAAGYGMVIGVVLNAIKISIIKLFRGKTETPEA
ncbi:MAG: hypothetical protein CO187_01480 [Zetaproteobacteria bacterium CG_4_9_14_3_um_filter_53_7]|nr:MAG: hypothetical protein CO187_01480 [Zetaproteobacteria bacterium CG_4_9_14_3_um_filter_53_7]